MKHPVAMITGGTRNTGLAIAERFANEGFDIVITSRGVQNAQETAQDLQKRYPEVTILGLGMVPAKYEEIVDAFHQIDIHFGRIDALVCNATAISNWKSVIDVTEDDLNFMMQSNVNGYFFSAQEAAKRMKAQKNGSIVMVSSVQTLGAVPKMSSYTASKCAINALSKAFAVEMAKYGIRCNTLLAGAIWSERWDDYTQEEIIQKRSNWPLEMESRPEDIADSVYFLCSQKAKMITGTEVTVDSGVSACLLKYNRNWDE